MSDILLNPETNDVVFVNGTTTMTYENKLTVAQKLKIKLLTYQGEWFMDTTQGLPYFQTILVRGISKTTIDSLFQEAILSEPEVVEIVEFNSYIDPETRAYRLSFRVRTNENQTTDYVDILIGA